VDIGEERGLVQAFAQERGLTFPILLDENGGVAQTYRVRPIPYTLFIDRQGVIRVQHIGAVEESLIAKYVDPIL
jgi:peroxiredoxin